ncbi:hypothetical protein D0809_18395 [Flavobacterium circumlabens]|uniref:Uncharacterized protein n=1 Tax=Flavobacterium circumlabens TaxID=2133765 RepID=A0A4Y7U984_9FLAO|nr:hypothetical protein D0809_18395 [Flavobacterium circumlabens]
MNQSAFPDWFFMYKGWIFSCRGINFILILIVQQSRCNVFVVLLFSTKVFTQKVCESEFLFSFSHNWNDKRCLKCKK